MLLNFQRKCFRTSAGRGVSETYIQQNRNIPLFEGTIGIFHELEGSRYTFQITLNLPHCDEQK